MNRKIKIVSTGHYLPRSVSSSEIEKEYNLPKGWSEKYSGVRRRHHVTFESNGYMGARAIESALEDSELDMSDIDLIIFAGGTFDYPLPNQSSIIKSELNEGLKYDIPTIDIDTTCLSFITSFDIASKMMDNYQYKNVIIVASEISSKGLNSKNPETLTLFGDASAAVILSLDDQEEQSYFIKGDMKTYSEGAYHTIIKGGGNNFFFKDNPYDEDLYSFRMDGRKLLKLASKKLKVFVDEFFEDIDYSIEDVDVLIPHQASKSGLVLLKKMYNFNDDKLMCNLSNYGNCIAASIPLLIHQSINNDRLRRGDLC